MAIWTLKQVGAKYLGSCIVCRESTHKQSVEATPLYVTGTGSAQRYGVAHAACVGASLKNAVQGQRLVGTPRASVDDTPAAAAEPTAEQMAELERLTAGLRRTAMERPASISAAWAHPSDVDEALKKFCPDLKLTGEDSPYAIRALTEKLAAREAKIAAAKVG